MTSLFALLVGINEYQAVNPLSGSRNDIASVRDFLRLREGDDQQVRIVTLTDHEATRDRVVATFRDHLGQAGPGDSALFWFSGHGSQVPVPQSLWHLEPSGFSQTLVCADSRLDGRPDLLDRELGALISEVAERGVHVAAVLDCCHAESGTREVIRPEPDPDADEFLRLGGALAVRWVPPGPVHPGGAVLPELTRGGAGGRKPDHVALAACRSHQVAYEIGPSERRRGAFTAALIGALERLGPKPTYRELMVATRCDLENSLRTQVPVLYPADPTLIDREFLGGMLRRPESPLILRHLHGAWELNAGRLHGLPVAGGDLRVALAGSSPLVEARVLEVLTERSLIEPAPWLTDAGRQYPVMLSRVPLPATTVAVGGRPSDDAASDRRIVAALATCGPGGTPSPHVRVAPVDAEAELRVATSGGEMRVTGLDGVALTGDLTAYGILGVVSRLEHIARWRTVKALAAPSSRLAGEVRLDVLQAGPGSTTAPRHGGTVIVAGPDGRVVLDYERRDGVWVAPQVFLRLRNLSGRRLFCVLLDLTDRYAIHPDLFPGNYIGAGRAAAAFDGEPVEFTLPDDRPVAPGAEVRDWIQLIVSTETFSSDVFRLDALADDRDAVGTHRLARRPVRFDPGWATVQVPIVTRVPHPEGSCPSEKDI
jgi:hypothetical protein